MDKVGGFALFINKLPGQFKCSGKLSHAINP